jgi:hypothetical protein
MENRQLFRLRPIDWRWFIVSYCFLVLFHLFPSFLISRVSDTVDEPFGFTVWLGAGIVVVCAIIGYWSREITILEPGLASVLYTFTLLGTLKTLWLFGRGYRSVAGQALLLLSMFVVGCLGSALGEWIQMRKERSQAA